MLLIGYWRWPLWETRQRFPAAGRGRRVSRGKVGGPRGKPRSLRFSMGGAQLSMGNPRPSWGRRWRVMWIPWPSASSRWRPQCESRKAGTPGSLGSAGNRPRGCQSPTLAPETLGGGTTPRRPDVLPTRRARLFVTREKANMPHSRGVPWSRHESQSRQEDPVPKSAACLA
jgi:hypothetical protein